MEVKFSLKDKACKSPTLINLCIYHGYKRLKYSTGLHVLPLKSEWNFKKQRFVEPELDLSKKKLHKEFNTKLQNMRADALSIVYMYESNKKELTAEAFRDEMNKIYKEHYQEPKKMLFFDHMQAWYKRLIEEKGFEKVKSRGTLINAIKRYYPNYDKLRFEDINIDFYNDFVSKLRKDDYTINTIGTFVRNLKAFMSDFYNRGEHSNTSFKQFKKMSEEVDHIYLDESELEKFMKVSVPKAYESTKDCFIIQCHTALRHSDLFTLSEHEIKNDLLTKKTAKTGKVISVPISQTVSQILDKNGGSFPKCESNQRMNKKLKEIAKAAKLNRKVPISEMEDGKKVIKTYEVWELVSTHTGRRTALTQMYLNGIDLFSLIKISGHTTVKQLQTYLRIDAQESAENLKNHVFFNR